MKKDFISLVTVTFCLITPQLRAADFSNHSSSSSWWFIAILIAAVASAAYQFWKKQLPAPDPDDPFSEQRITQTFISALPTITRELNLEIATSWQMEILERTDTRIFLGLNLGTNQATIRTPVTYRYHIRLQDPWILKRKGNAIMVQAPMIRASQPPAIHTDQMEIQSRRGWCRSSAGELVDQLHRDLTPTVCAYADDPRRMGFIREPARHSVAEFVRLWLEKENRWHRSKFTQIHVCFRDEQMPSQPTIQLTEPSHVQLH